MKLKSIEQLKQEIEVAEKKFLLQASYLPSIICIRFYMPDTYDKQKDLVERLSTLKKYVSCSFMGVVRVHHVMTEYPRRVEMFIQHDFS